MIRERDLCKSALPTNLEGFWTYRLRETASRPWDWHARRRRTTPRTLANHTWQWMIVTVTISVRRTTRNIHGFRAPRRSPGPCVKPGRGEQEMESTLLSS